MGAKTPESGGATGGWSGGRSTVLALIVLVLIFVFENRRAIRVRLLVSDVTIPLWTALLATAAIGGLCGAYVTKRRGGSGVE
ncbi:DUF1049 domain-containing protein [Streptomyces sp. V3I7]|uniref:DUF1049 domain-containing protein n=1 Tax=Streptomyces sp. V3I7 TaxID=3042278 RepID=UPI002785CF52|nr:DUF1049 domain-containing protein [Streptomyces sp. V3I7]MDQ0993937.1 putative integral membrane protein [Streptomyces sp. V3I7]